jgi:hypothetical protein
MKKTLLALAAVGVLASTGAVANGADERVPHMTPVQYHGNDYRHDERYREWYDHSANIYDRGQKIRNWIDRGISDGRINQGEARRLQRELARFEEKERSFNRDGRISHREEEELNRDLDRLADNVRQQMRD